MQTVTESASTVNFDRAAFRMAVADVVSRAHAKLPECASRIDRAATMVLSGNVELLPDGTAKVASQSNGTTAYHVVNGSCPCKDFAKAPGNYCKHRLAHGILRRVNEMLQASTPPPAPPSTPLPEAPVSITLKATLHGHEVLVTLRGTDFASVKADVEQAAAWLASQAPAQPTGQGEGWCSTHGLQMRQTTKNGQSWYSHKTADGWCKGR